jgi:di/tricarboxylate transporter
VDDAAISFAVLFGGRLLPHRTARHLPPDFSQHAAVLAQQYGLEATANRLAAGGVLAPPAGVAGSAADAVYAPFTPQRGVAEAVVRPRSGLIGTAVFPGMVTESGELVILAVQRGGEDQGPGETALRSGDTLLVQGTWAALQEHLADPDVLVVDAPEQVRRQAVPLGQGSRPALAVLAGMVVLLATGAVPAVVAAFLTPVATPANLMVLGPGGYRFGDYWKLGLPLLLLFVAVATLLVPLIWPF